MELLAPDNDHLLQERQQVEQEHKARLRTLVADMGIEADNFGYISLSQLQAVLMVASGTGVNLKPAEGEYHKPCGTCLRRARERGLVVG